MGRRIFRWMTILLFLLTAWAAYANVYADDTEVRSSARAVANRAAGCGEGCKLEGLRGDRGMFAERIEYDIVGRGHFVVTCQRPYIAFGEHRCVLTEQQAR